MKDLLLACAREAVKAADPALCLAPHLPEPPAGGHTYVIGAGKAAAKMAQAFEAAYKAPFSGIVVTRYGHAVPTNKIKVIEASHPVPDEAGQQAAREILALVQKAGKDDLVICLLSGGGSALLSHAAEGIPFEDYKHLTLHLLKSGASIQEINTVRKHLSTLFGGRLAQAAAPARLVTLAISDVAGDDPSIIASGPTVSDPGTIADVMHVFEKWDINAGEAITAYLQNPANETPKPGDPVFENTAYKLIATPQKSLEAGARLLRDKGITPHILSDSLEGDTNQAAGFHAALIRQIIARGQPFTRPCALLSGGETTVRVTGTGQGGPNTQFLLALAMELQGLPEIFAIACDTDGIDGSMDNAGAYIDADTLQKAHARGLNPKEFLRNNDSYNFFNALGDLVVTGPTHTNVNDFRVIYIGDASA